MNGRERILIALERGQPDIVPVWEMAYNEPSIIGIARYFADADELPEPKLVMDMTDEERFKLLGGLITFVRELDLEGVTAISLAPRERLDHDHIRDALGVVYHLSQFGEPYPVNGPIHDAADLKSFRMRPPEEADFLMLDVLRSTFPEKSIAYHMPGTFKLSWTLRGAMEKLLMDYILNPDLSHDLARMVTDYCFGLIETAFAKGADFIALEGDLVLFHKGDGPWSYQDIQTDARMVYVTREVPGEVSYLVTDATTLSVQGMGEVFHADDPTTASGTVADQISPTILSLSSAGVHDRGVGEVLLEIPDDGTFSEPRSTGVSKLVLEFSEPIDPLSLSSAIVEVVGVDANSGTVALNGVSTTVSAGADPASVAIEFNPPLPDFARYTVRILAVTDLGGNEVSGDADRIFTALEGDATGDLRTNATDLSRVRANRTDLIDPSAIDEVRSDVTCDGRVNATDLSRVRARRGKDATGISLHHAPPWPCGGRRGWRSPGSTDRTNRTHCNCLSPRPTVDGSPSC